MNEGILVIGGSLGGLEAAKLLIEHLEESFTDPILIVLHRARTSAGAAMTRAFSNITRRPVCEADDKMPLEGGRIHIAPADYHTFVDGDRLTLSFDEPVRFSRPSIDVAIESAVRSYGSGTTVAVLSGANDDGTRGATEVHAVGGTIFVQDPATARAREMPEAAIKAVPAARVLSPDQIGRAISELRGEERR